MCNTQMLSVPGSKVQYSREKILQVLRVLVVFRVYKYCEYCEYSQYSEVVHSDVPMELA